MSLGPGAPASETGDDSLSAITFDSDSETKAKRKSYHRPPHTSPKSPYHSKPKKVASWRPLRTAGTMPLGGRMSLTPQKLWLGTSKQGSLTQPLRSDLTLEHAWTNPPGSTPGYLSEALRMKRSHLRRSASNGHVPGTPVYREKEDMYDEIIELKKSLHMQRGDVDLMRTKLRRLEEENNRKDRQIEQLLDPTRGPDFVRTLAEKRPDTGWVVNGLKQRILKLEQQCKEKDSTINKLQTDMKTTNLEEMRVAMETYYEEIHRLQTLLASSETTGKKPAAERRMGLRRQKKVSSALLTLSRSVQELTEENHSLKEDLDRVLSSSPTVSKITGYMEWSKPRLLRRIAELEKKINSMESSKSHTLELGKSSPLAQPASSSAEPSRPDPPEEKERLRGALRSLKDERVTLHARLLDRDLEVKHLLQAKADLERELQSVKEGEKERREKEEALREEIQTLTQKCQELEEIKKEEKDGPMEVNHETPEDPPTSCASSSHSPQDAEPDSREPSPWPPSPCAGGQGEDWRREEAARILQSWWKAYQHKKEEAVLDEAAIVLQTAFRGHLARAKLLSSKACGSDSPSVPHFPNKSSPDTHAQSPVPQAGGGTEHEEAIAIIQSVFRAHLARTWPSATSKRATTATSTKGKPAPGAHRGAASSPLATYPVQEDGDGSSREALGESAAEEEPLRLPEPTTSAQQPCPGSSLSGPLPAADEVHSDDSDDVISPSLPGKKDLPVLGPRSRPSHDDGSFGTRSGLTDSAHSRLPNN
ncbi:IQ domain-containing protein E isoform X3 [Tamandua tetradactyla]|uniref:IQ domain-containing protein E isoform X3 n=1 Tax=Tamandua tetradactyla TaxID=48850 RepID=UPI004053A7B5